jgi:hypothetical protein
MLCERINRWPQHFQLVSYIALFDPGGITALYLLIPSHFPRFRTFAGLFAGALFSSIFAKRASSINDSVALQ